MQIAYFTVAYWCVLVAALLPLVCAGVGKFGQFGKLRPKGGYDNANPRAWWARQTDWRARANAAMANTFEALPFFFAAVIIAHLLGANQARLDIMAFLFVLLRILYIMMYLADMAKVRTVLWIMGFLLNIGILFLGFR
jgi:uncharacterized MAPEG superfamily protein